MIVNFIWQSFQQNPGLSLMLRAPVRPIHWLVAAQPITKGIAVFPVQRKTALTLHADLITPSRYRIEMTLIHQWLTLMIKRGFRCDSVQDMSFRVCCQ